MEELLSELKQAVVDGDDTQAASLTKACLDNGINPGVILKEAVVVGIEEAGRLWRENEFFMPDIILSAEAFKAAMDELAPMLDSGTRYRSRVLIGTVEGDMHDLGKSIVSAMLSGAGFEVIDLGIDVPTRTFIEKTRELKPHILGIGAYMSTTMLLMEDVIRGLEEEGIRDQVKVIVGGIPTSAEFAAQIGADAWSRDALEAVVRVRELTDS